MFKKVLVANRGEIAVRVIRACRELGISTVGVYSDADRGALHVRMADQAFNVGPAPSRESYLVIEKILDAARRSGADAIHPGYGFLAENASFAKACEDAGITFIGPSSQSIALMGSKVESRRATAVYGVPMVPGTLDPVESDKEARGIADSIGYPIMLKASAGGGGKGLRFVAGPEELESALRNTRSEALAAFGDSAVYIEKFVDQPRHVEIQVDSQRRFYFLEMNTRLQVEHPVTEMVTGIDLVKLQLKVASGEQLGLLQDDIEMRGAAIECRVYAEDPENNFFPSPGTISMLRTPAGPGVRDDSGVYEGWTVPIDYDPLLSKLVAWGSTREEAIQRLQRALREYHVGGIKTNVAFFIELLEDANFRKGDFDTGFIARWLKNRAPRATQDSVLRDLEILAAAIQHSNKNSGTAGRTPSAPESLWKSSGRVRAVRRS